jgi:hypothetical protein
MQYQQSKPLQQQQPYSHYAPEVQSANTYPGIPHTAPMPSYSMQQQQHIQPHQTTQSTLIPSATTSAPIVHEVPTVPSDIEETIIDRLYVQFATTQSGKMDFEHMVEVLSVILCGSLEEQFRCMSQLAPLLDELL